MKNEFIGLNNFYETKDVGKKTRDLEGGFYRKNWFSVVILMTLMAVSSTIRAFWIKIVWYCYRRHNTLHFTIFFDIRINLYVSIFPL